MKTVILKNKTLSEIEIEDQGFKIEAGKDRDISCRIFSVCTSKSLESLINAGSIVVNNGVKDLNAVQGLAWLDPRTYMSPDGNVWIKNVDNLGSTSTDKVN